MSTSPNSIHIREYLAAITVRALREQNIFINIDPFTITYVGHQNQSTHDRYCVFDILHDDYTVTLYVSPLKDVTPKIGQTVQSFRINGKLTHNLYVHIDEGIFKLGNNTKLHQGGYYSTICPSLDVYLFELGVLETEELEMAILLENEGMIELENNGRFDINNDYKRIIYLTEKAIREDQLVNTDVWKPRLVINPGKILYTVGETYVEPGAEVMDEVTESAITVNITGEVNTTIPGEYVMVYSATDLNGNVLEKRQTIKVVVDAPQIEMYGQPTEYADLNSFYSDPGALGWDAHGNALAVITNSNLDTSVAGTYTITYIVTDSNDTTTSESRNVVVA